ncbi:MAG: biotin/lipoyl-binding protein, partial [Christensenella sp.]
MSGENVVKTKKKKKWPFIVLGIVIILIVALVVVSSMQPPAVSAASMMQQATVQKGSIVETVVGSGNLEYGDTQDLKVPAGIKIDKVLVEKGDYVEQGEALATVDATSLQVKLTSIKDELDELDEQINATKDDTASDVIKSHVNGRVKAIAASEGSDAADVMVEAGSLMTISIDGKMAVDIESTATLSTGDKVKVELADGSIKDGTVERKAGNVITVTLTDNGPAVDEAVTVRDKDGNELGKGTLAVNNPITIAGTGGTIDKIHVEENEKVSKGSKLVTLSDVALSSEHAELQQQRADLMESYQTLVLISKTGSITAQGSGTIESINIADGTVVSAASASSQSSSSGSSDSSSSQDSSSYEQQMRSMG